MTYDIASTPTVFVDHNALRQMDDRVAPPGTRAVLVGYGEYAKHLINRRQGNILAVYDPDERKQGIAFRGVPVLPAHQKVDANLIVACEYPLAYEFLGKIVALYGNVPHFVPSTISHKSTIEINVFEQEDLYIKLFKDVSDAPLSMMVIEKIKFLLEMLRLGLTFEGDVVEMGSWQGGSTWYMGRLLSLLGEKRTLYAMDLFEAHVMDPTATMCNDEIKRRLEQAYAHCEMVHGLCDSDESLGRIRAPICFAHIDLGALPKALDHLWDNMPSGAPIVLDNYGHLAATWPFDDFFAAKGTRVNRLPWSEQGLVFRR